MARPPGPPHDFRSDTVTRPSAAMRRAMAEAEVGDDVLGDDPTVRTLEEEVAALFGREAALFMATGTQGNQVAAHVQARPGEEVLVGATAHCLDWEMGALAALSGLQARPLPDPQGRISPEDVRVRIRPAGGFRPACRLLLVENTHNFCGGAVVPVGHLEGLSEVVHGGGGRLHLDGARLWNAAVAEEVPLPRYGALADTLMVSFSKGLGAPIGSALVGDEDLVATARDVRKRLGGGMRQVGVLAAPALIGLRQGRDRLREDHARARKLAEDASALSGVELPFGLPATNILFLRFLGRSARALEVDLRSRGILALATSADTIRFVTHLDVDDRGVEAVRDALADILGVRAR